jgi:hypothetical protein
MDGNMPIDLLLFDGGVDDSLTPLVFDGHTSAIAIRPRHR